ncbi:transcription factor bHLH92 [Cucurbita moschata]|uniref:Transcription factor bHLH92 n=1 Tax=Cucurbita moschata TaxID=3662 RepID=A0A6J1H311_CUCMO|nr:transcription factor bHLH92 [Cucurbita moschata]
MDDTFPVEFWHNDLFWLDAPISVPVPVSAPAQQQKSAFVPYLSRPNFRIEQKNKLAAPAASNSVNKRVIEYWRKQWHEKKEAAALGDLEREKCHRHMMNERTRREREKQSYLGVHSLLPKKTKNDKNSIVQAAARTIQELRASEEMLKRRNSELEMAIAAKNRENAKGTKPIRLEWPNPSAGIDSMLAVLNVLKTGRINPKAIHANFFNSLFSAQLAIDDTHMGGAEVERVLQATVREADGRFRRQC